jgi:ubiquinone/menaquinone biosynthesis C-methylase UbiE
VPKSVKNKFIDYERINIVQKDSETDSFTEERYVQFFHYFKKNTTNVLDIGCNTGRGGAMLKKLDSMLEISGLDVVKERLKNIPEGIYAKKILGSSTEIPSEDEQFDAVVAGEFIEHLYAVDVDLTIFEIFRVLKIGGRALLTTPNPNYIKRKAKNRTILGGAHFSQHHNDALRMKLRMAGFSRVKVFGSGRVTRYLGYRFPMLSVYGSYLIIGDKC